MQTTFADGVLHASAAAIGLAAWAFAVRTPSPRARRNGFVAVLLAGLVSFPGIDRITGEGLPHAAELFHYALGAKYFPELGYTGLYDATVRATVDAGLPMPSSARDLVSSRVESADVARRRGDVYAERFTPERWLDFQVDVATIDHEFGGVERDAILDHGFNATPPWIALARPIVGRAPLDRGRFVAFACIDLVLLSGLLVAFARRFGLERTALVVLFVGTAFSFRFAWIGGSLLRFDWVLAIGLAMVAFRSGWPMLAGIALAQATASRIFPVMFAVTAGCALIARAIDRRDAIPLGRFVFGFAATLALLFLVGATSGRGPVAYREFAARFETHRATWASNHIGFESVVVADRILFGEDEATGEGEAAYESYDAIVEHARDARRPIVVAVGVLVLALIAWLSRRLEPHQALPLGAILCFSLSTISGYYWVMLAPVPLVAPSRTTAALVVCTFVHAFVEIALDAFTAAHLVVSVLFTLIFADWLVAIARQSTPEVTTA